MAEVYTGGSTDNSRDSTKWAVRPVDPGLEAEFLRRLMIKLGSDQERARTAVASASTPSQDRMRLTVSGDVQVLEVPEAFDRAWRRVGLALDRGGFTVEDRDRSQGVYFVRYIDPDAESSSKPGFMARLFSRSDANKNANAQQFRVRLEGSGETTRVTVLNREGQPLATEIDRRTGTRILSLLRDQL
jgi:outer membrane protein assembly factor BamC